MRRRVIVLAIALSAGAGSLWAMQRPAEEGIVSVAGTIEARDVEVGSQVGGRVASVHVGEGDAVEAGAPIVTFEANLLDPQIEEQRGEVAEVRARLELLERGSRDEDIARARLEWKNADREESRMARLLEGGVVSQQEHDDAVTRAALLREVLRAHENGSRVEDIAAARAAVAREEGRLEYLLRQRDEMIVRAPGAGVVQTIDLRPGDLVAARAPVARLFDPRDQWVRAYVPEPQLGLVRIGQRAEVTVDTWPSRRFWGVVTEIATRAEYTPRNVQTLSQRNEQVFAVDVTLDPADELKPGMAAIVTLGRHEGGAAIERQGEAR